MADYLSPQVRGIKPSGIRRFFDLANGRKDIITLGVGEPDFVTPWHVREASVYALEMGKTQYTSNAGTPELREEIGYLSPFSIRCYCMIRQTRFLLLSAEAKRLIWHFVFLFHREMRFRSRALLYLIFAHYSDKRRCSSRYRDIC